MHRHITYYNNQLSARVDSQINFSVVVHGRMQDLSTGTNYFFFLGGGACDAWRSHAFARGVRGHASPEIFWEWSNLVRSGAYFHKFFTFKKSKNIIFYTKIVINCSHILARGSRSMVHSPLIIFTGEIYNVFDTISPSIFFINIHFLYNK